MVLKRWHDSAEETAEFERGRLQRMVMYDCSINQQCY
jgi:hypothetical protein